MSTTNPTRAAFAALNLANTWSVYTVADIGGKLTCEEADALIDFLQAVGADDKAAALVEAHTKSDEEGDLHYTGTQKEDQA